MKLTEAGPPNTNDSSILDANWDNYNTDDVLSEFKFTLNSSLIVTAS